MSFIQIIVRFLLLNVLRQPRHSYMHAMFHALNSLSSKYCSDKTTIQNVFRDVIHKVYEHMLLPLQSSGKSAKQDFIIVHSRTLIDFI